MTEFEKADTNGSGSIDKDEWAALELEDRKRRLDDADAKRDAQRRMTWFALSGMILYPLVILAASLAGLDTAASAVAAAYFGFNAMEAKNNDSSTR